MQKTKKPVFPAILRVVPKVILTQYRFFNKRSKTFSFTKTYLSYFPLPDNIFSLKTELLFCAETSQIVLEPKTQYFMKNRIFDCVLQHHQFSMKLGVYKWLSVRYIITKFQGDRMLY